MVPIQGAILVTGSGAHMELCSELLVSALYMRARGDSNTLMILQGSADHAMWLAWSGDSFVCEWSCAVSCSGAL